MLHRVLLLIVLALTSAAVPARAGDSAASAPASEARIGVLLVNHGSRSQVWRDALLQLEASVAPSIRGLPGITDLKTAFMEYTEPSIATRMREFDEQGVSDVIIVPIFLTVSPHTFDDIPTIIGLKTDPGSLQLLKVEKIERYAARARVHITPRLDFANLLQENVLRRVKAISRDPAREGLVLIGYGDQTYEREWIELFAEVAGHVRQETGIDGYAYGWCGHLVEYRPEETSAAIRSVLESSDRALVVPVLVAHDEMFQVDIIGRGIAAVPDHSRRVVYRPDAILPDPGVESWVVQAVREQAQRIRLEPRR